PLHALLYVAIAIVVGFLTYRRPALGVGAMIVCLPFAEARYAFDTSMTIPKAAFAGFVLALLWHRPSFAILRRPPMPLIVSAFAAVLLAIALSAATALHKEAVLREFAKWLEYAILFVTVAVAFDNDSDDRPIWWSLIGIAIFESLYGIAQLFVGAPSGVIVQNHILPRIAGSLEGPNQFSGWLNLIFPVLFARMLLHRSAWLVLAVALSGAATALTLSRSGIVAAFVAIAIVIAMSRPPKNVSLRLAGGGAIALAVLIGAALMVGFEWHFFSLAEVPVPNHLGTRAILWTSAATLWQHSPIVGVGAGNFELDLGLVGHTDVRTHANSVYLQFLAETGAIGFAALLWLIYATIVPFVRRYSRRALVIGFAAANIAIVLHQIFDYLWFFPKVGGVWALLL
ncbi:MAG: O-antigen ligase family protein, partial [Polyangiaceae bacterium]